jgi:hypothetical protein
LFPDVVHAEAAMTTDPRPTSELIAELRDADPHDRPFAAEETLEAAATRLSSILKAWEAFRYSSRPDEYQALECAITGTSTEVRG